MKRLYISILLMAFGASLSFAQNSGARNVTREEIIAQMNYYMYSLTTILEDQSMSVLGNEIDILENNLRVKDVAKMDRAVAEYRKGLLANLQDLKLSVEEQEVVNQVNALKSSNAKWKALSSGLNQVLVLVPGVGGKTGGKQIGAQLAYQAILTAARTAVEYKTMKGEQQVEELQAMWEFKKKKLDILNKQNVAAYELVQDLYRIYYGKLDEKDRLTKEDVKNFISIINEEDPKIRLERLSGNRNKKLQIMPEYWYYLGMTYIDLNNPTVGLNYLDKYLIMYAKAPIFYKDQKSGCVALAKLAYGSNLSATQQRYYSQIAIDNLPYSGSALIQCANTYLSLGDYKKAYSEIAEGINEPRLQDKNALITFSASLFPEIKKYESEYSSLDYAISHCQNVGINNLLSYYLERDGWSARSSEKVVTSVSSDKDADEDDEIWINTNPDCTFDFREIEIATITCSCGEYEIIGRSLSLGKGIKLSQIEDKFPYFKNHKIEIYRFFTKLYGSDDRYSVKAGLDYNKIRKGEEQASSFFESFTDPSKKRTEQRDAFKQCKKLADFLEEKSQKTNLTANIIAKEDKKVDKSPFTSYAKVLSDKNHHNVEKNENVYLVILFKGEIPTVLIYERKKQDDDFYSFNLCYQGLAKNTFSAPWIQLITKAETPLQPSFLEKISQLGSDAVDYTKDKAGAAAEWVGGLFSDDKNGQETTNDEKKKESIKGHSSEKKKEQSSESTEEKSLWNKIYEKGQSVKNSILNKSDKK